MIKIYAVNNGTQPFLDGFSLAYLQSQGIQYTTNPLFADVFLAAAPGFRRAKLARSIFWFKRFVYWTNEPRFNTTFENFESSDACTMNVYSKDVFLHNLHFLGSYHYDFANNLGVNLQEPPGYPMTQSRLSEKKHFCAAFFGYRDPEQARLIKDGIDISLNGLRQELATFLYKKGKAHIFGSGWPSEIKVEEDSGFESGGETWWDRKIAVLKDYKYNICYENTIAEYYCTEKLWHATASGSLGIYWGNGTKVYETFPENSFIDASLFESSEQLYLYLENLPDAEYIDRYNSCLNTLHNACEYRLTNSTMRTDVIDSFVEKVKILVQP